MRLPEGTEQVFLRPGEMYFGTGNVQVCTVLGSCVALTVWHPESRFGGLCHAMLPQRMRRTTEALDGRFADEAFEMVMAAVDRRGRPRREYQCKLFGGGRMFADPQAGGNHYDVPGNNIDGCRALAVRHGLIVSVEDLGGRRSRYLVFDLTNGDVWVRKRGVAVSSTLRGAA